MSHQSDLISTDINAYLAQHESKELLRFLTCGNVDDGKSTLIGRLWHDSKMIYEDQLAAVQADSVKSGTTIDVAYRYFSTSNHKFIIADTPGHEQYTHNMATGASNELAIAIKNAGLLCVCLNVKPAAADLIFDCDEYSVDDLYAALKNHDLIHSTKQ